MGGRPQGSPLRKRHKRRNERTTPRVSPTHNFFITLKNPKGFSTVLKPRRVGGALGSADGDIVYAAGICYGILCILLVRGAEGFSGGADQAPLL